MSYKWQPDFVLKVGGSDLTKLTETWSLNDVEDGLSTLTATIINKDLSVNISVNDKAEIRFGYQNDLSDQVEMHVKEVTESYSENGSKVSFTAYDCLERMTGVMARGLGDDDDIKKLIENLGEGVTPPIKVEVGDITNPKVTEEYRVPIANEKVLDAQRRLLSLGGNKKAQKKGSTPSAKGTKAIRKQSKGKKIPNFEGEVKEGMGIAQGPGTTEQKVKALEDMQSNFLTQKNLEASSQTERAAMNTLGVPHLKAKTVIKVDGVGRPSGEWYVKGATHSWSIGGGYTTNCDLIRNDEAPMVQYAEIYKKDSMYAGPRKIDQGSSHTFTFGRSDKRIIHFKWTESVQESRNAGENAQARRIPIDAVSEETVGLSFDIW